ncbi:sensor histidine kinase [Candidatus Viridilinea mediisalina]|uniref:Circadian input-output histidine kinase CikA n=1 Tax=Candidatus Viridilinea mediisalina TaxID=2024553 RepID=A0A2A6RIC6_9CHLR|nr:ATP-binding protein [Candidatus Viridilinea mediisalina]PDW02772.1 histidine kinase [Candidatus Viridilinea mediisalina]
MKFSFPIRAKLLSAFALDLMLMIALGLVASQQMAVMHARASFVADHTIPSLEVVAALKAHINEYRVNQLEFMLYTNDADKDRSLQRMLEIEERMDQALDSYRPLINSDAEELSFARVEERWQALVEATHTNFVPDALQSNTGTVRPFYSRLNPIYSGLERAIGDLTTESQHQADESLVVVEQAYSTARTFIMADTILVIVVSAVIGFGLSNNIARRIGTLSSAANKVSGGDLEQPVAVRGRDELAQLGHTFNQMIASLRSQRSALQERNQQLQASLERQEQLTADVLRGKQAEAEAQQAQVAAEAASQAKSMFLATMSHELRTPLNAILGYAQIMQINPAYPKPAAGDVDPLDRILSAGRHLKALINNVLDFSKIEQGKIDLNLAPVDLAAVLREAADVVAPLAERQQNQLKLEYAPELGRSKTDADKLRQVLINLLANAAKFTENGTITLRAQRDDAGIVFEVEDTGIGIAPADHERIFQPFSQVDGSVTRRYEGTGLGLTLSRELCHVLGGTISVESTLGQGSTFRIWLPTERPEQPCPSRIPAATPCPSQAHLTPSMRPA